MKRLLLIGPNFHYFLSSIGRALELCGYEIKIEAYDNPVHPYSLKNKLLYKLARNKASVKAKSRVHYKPYIEAQFKSFQPDVVFILNGDNLLPETIQLFTKTSKVGIWLFDSIMRMPECGHNLPYAHRVFCYEQQDIPMLKKQFGIDALFLPQAVDEKLYFRFEKPVERKWDIVFAGDLVHSVRRRSIIQAVVAHYPDLRIRVWGIYKLWFKNLWLWLTRERRDVYTNCSASADQLNADYNAARIVLNIHHEQQQVGANPKVYEIAASGAYQICDYNPFIASLFPNNTLGLYKNLEELFERIDYALSHEMDLEASLGCKLVTEKHTFSVRMREMLNQLL